MVFFGVAARARVQEEGGNGFIVIGNVVKYFARHDHTLVGGTTEEKDGLERLMQRVRAQPFDQIMWNGNLISHGAVPGKDRVGDKGEFEFLIEGVPDDCYGVLQVGNSSEKFISLGLYI